MPILYENLGLCQRVRRKRRALIKRCRLSRDIKDQSPRADILLGLAELRDSVGSLKVAPSVWSSATLLHSLLWIFYDKMKAHAANGYEGIPNMVYAEISGYAGLRCLRRMDANCLQYEKAAAVKEPRNPRSGGGSGWSRGRGGNRPRPRGDNSNRKCYLCFSPGHVKANCPEKDKMRTSISK